MVENDFPFRYGTLPLQTEGKIFFHFLHAHMLPFTQMDFPGMTEYSAM